MPLYEYECNVCQHVHEQFRSIDARNDAPACPLCDCSDADLVIGTPSFDPRMGTDPSFPTAYAKWGKKHQALHTGKMKDSNNN